MIPHRIATAAVAAASLLSLTPAVQAAGGHEQITGPFINAQSVTLQCLSCHAKEGQDILRTSHWTWQRQRTINGETKTFAKKDGLTTFAIAAGSNPRQCMTCHISTNLTSGSFDPTSPANIDCLVCHDTSGTYRRENGVPAQGLDLVRIARSVGTPTARNCSTCHANGCGLPGGAEHGGVETDVHLSAAGGSLSCQDCHPGNNNHAFTRELAAGIGPQRTTDCTTCHSPAAHSQGELNRHAEVIDCRTCHIPNFGTNSPAVISWNWLAQTGAEVYLDRDGGVQIINGNGLTLASEVRPAFFWDDGSETVYQRGMKVDPDTSTVLVGPGKRTIHSRITPFAASYATQLYDTKYRYLISPKLAAAGDQYFLPGRWAEAAETGMLELRLPFSGSFGFTPTVSYRRLSHGVQPADHALDCMDCHGKSGRVGWKQLGYEMDPWMTTSAPPPLQPQAQPAASDNRESVTLPIVQESVLPGDGTGR